MKRRTVVLILLGSALAQPCAPSDAEVRFGNHVFVGGHNVSDQTFNSQRRGLYVIHEGKPAHEGCVWRANGDGSQTKICHLQRRLR